MNDAILSVHTPAYLQKWSAHVASQRRYAARFDYEFVSVTLPRENTPADRGMVQWRKLFFLKSLLQTHARVLLLDTDVLVQPHAPDIRQTLVEDKLIYMARGHSGRYNSGVMFVVSHPKSISFLQAVVDSRGTPVSAENYVNDYGENGHIIQWANHPDFRDLIGELDQRWNNNADPKLRDFFRHFSAGPLRRHSNPAKSARRWLIRWVRRTRK